MSQVVSKQGPGFDKICWEGLVFVKFSMIDFTKKQATSQKSPRTTPDDVTDRVIGREVGGRVGLVR